MSQSIVSTKELLLIDIEELANALMETGRDDQETQMAALRDVYNYVSQALSVLRSHHRRWPSR